MNNAIEARHHMASLASCEDLQTLLWGHPKYRGYVPCSRTLLYRLGQSLKGGPLRFLLFVYDHSFKLDYSFFTHAWAAKRLGVSVPTIERYARIGRQLGFLGSKRQGHKNYYWLTEQVWKSCGTDGSEPSKVMARYKEESAQKKVISNYTVDRDCGSVENQVEESAVIQLALPLTPPLPPDSTLDLLIITPPPTALPPEACLDEPKPLIEEPKPARLGLSPSVQHAIAARGQPSTIKERLTTNRNKGLSAYLGELGLKFSTKVGFSRLLEPDKPKPDSS